MHAGGAGATTGPHPSLCVSQPGSPTPGLSSLSGGGKLLLGILPSGPGGLWMRVLAKQPGELFRGQLWGKSVSGFSQIPNLEAKLKFTDPRPQNFHGHGPPGLQVEAPRPHLGFVQATPGGGGGRKPRVSLP